MPSQAQRVFFSVGCFMFSPKGSDEPSTETWNAMIKESLEMVPNIHEVDVSIQGLMNTHWDSSIEYASPLGGSRWPSVQPDQGKVSFRVRIPERMQDSISSGRTVGGGVEDFEVVTYHTIQGPVTFVICLDPETNEIKPSLAVMIVREFLKKELPLRTEDIAFHWAGPSPFHADMIAIFGNEDYNVICKPERGYDLYEFHCPVDAFDSALDASRALFPRLRHELTLYYLLTRKDAVRMHDTFAFTERIESLLAVYRQKSIRARLGKWRTLNRQTRELTIEAIGEEYRIRTEIDYDREFVESFYRSAEFPAFREAMDFTSRNDRHLAEIRSARETLETLERFRSKEAEISALSLAPLLGAAAGAVVSLVFG